jgi:hypothetical protein
MKIWFVLFLSFFVLGVREVEARSGCCSRHGGVCGCSCCDGTNLSSTCAPYYPECGKTTQTIIEKNYPTPVPTREIRIYSSNTPKPLVNVVTTNQLFENEQKTESSSFGEGLFSGAVLTGIAYFGYKLFKKSKQ